MMKGPINIYAGTVQRNQDVYMVTLIISTVSLSLDIRCDFKDVFPGHIHPILAKHVLHMPSVQGTVMLLHTLGYIWTCSHV